MAAVAGWSETNGCQGNQTAGEPFGFAGTGCLNSPGVLNQPDNISGDVGYFQTGLYIEHVATGLWIYGAYGREFLSDMPTGTFIFDATHSANLNGLNSEPQHWYVKGGLRERWTSLGHTVLYGFYGQRDDMIGEAAVADENIVGSRTRQ